MTPTYLLIIKAVLYRPPGAQATRTERFFGEQHDWPPELRNWMEQRSFNPWPCYREMTTHASFRRGGRTYYVPARANVPPFVALQEADAADVRDVRARWPEWFIEAVPTIYAEDAADLWTDVQPYEDEK